MSARTPDAPGTAPGPVPSTDVKRSLYATERRTGLTGAWLWLLALPASFFVAFFLAHIPFAIWTDQVEGTPGPWWFNLLVGSILVVVTWLPVGASALYARRALRGGSRWAWVPMAIDAALTLGALALIVAGAWG